jgi:predicted NUDIX family NTP pyrophosphohydrolase
MKRSAGILVYKLDKENIKVLLCHFGGPYWKYTDIGAWSLPKGEVRKNEIVLDAAIREFKEETNLDITSSIKYLGTKKISRKKLAIMFYTNSDFNLSNCKSNTFNLEFPRGSNNIQSFPEMDKYEWMTIEEAKNKIIKNQLYFLNKLEEKINRDL